MIHKFINRVYVKSKPDDLSRRAIIQCYLILLLIFNFTLHMLPFVFWKKIICHAFGVKLGSRTTLCSGVRFLGFGHCSIGDRTIVNRDCILDNRYELKIGSDVSIATGTKIFTQGHDINDANFSITKGGVTIEDNVCIFASALILPNVHLGKGCVVFPGSVVTKSYEPLAVVGGNPARRVKSRIIYPEYRLVSGFWFS